MEKVVYTVDEIAELLRISRPTAYDGIRDGKIPSIKIGRRLLVPKVAFDRYLETAGATVA